MAPLFSDAPVKPIPTAKRSRGGEFEKKIEEPNAGREHIRSKESEMVAEPVCSTGFVDIKFGEINTSEKWQQVR